MHRTLSLLAVVAVAGLVAHGSRAHAEDVYLENLKPGADAGTTAVSTLGITGAQVMLYCSGFEVKHKACELGACAATINDSPITAEKSTDICLRGNQTQLSVFRTYDGGVPDCRLYRVNPKTICPP